MKYSWPSKYIDIDEIDETDQMNEIDEIEESDIAISKA